MSGHIKINDQDQYLTRVKLRVALLEIANSYDIVGEQFRSSAYSRAADLIISRNPKSGKFYVENLATAEEAKGIGDAIAGDIREFLRRGKITRVDKIKKMKEYKTMQLFRGILGVGDTTARKFIKAGCKTLKDVERLDNITSLQKIGLKYYDDLNERFSRAEAAGIVAQVCRHIKYANPVVLGSYRRKKADVGDLDIMISGRGWTLERIANDIESGMKSRFIVRVLLGVQKYTFLACGSTGKARSVDIFHAPEDEKWTFMQYGTGSAMHNEYLRSIAKAKGMKLSEHGLFNAWTGKRYSISSERDVYRTIGVPYVAPEKR